jgi:lipopolysaccharide/colanic/teichoic acid biosynthesis glycosyltransferase
MKRVFDILVAVSFLAVTAVVIVPVLLAVWLEDRRSPLYLAPRIGRDGKRFRMVKIRTMVIDAERNHVDSTADDDVRITRIGGWLRRHKFDELTQFWNVLAGDMSVVGPRPNVERETALYTPEERRLLTVRPGITDFASIAFADLGEILRNHPDPNIGYNQLVRPGKSALGLFYVDHASLSTDLLLCILTAVSLASRARGLNAMGHLLRHMGAPAQLVETATRSKPLAPAAPPGASVIVTDRTQSGKC